MPVACRALIWGLTPMCRWSRRVWRGRIARVRVVVAPMVSTTSMPTAMATSDPHEPPDRPAAPASRSAPDLWTSAHLRPPPGRQETLTSGDTGSSSSARPRRTVSAATPAPARPPPAHPNPAPAPRHTTATVAGAQSDAVATPRNDDCPQPKQSLFHRRSRGSCMVSWRSVDALGWSPASTALALLARADTWHVRTRFGKATKFGRHCSTGFMSGDQSGERRPHGEKYRLVSRRHEQQGPCRG